jgi:hypothetical protein
MFVLAGAVRGANIAVLLSWNDPPDRPLLSLGLGWSAKERGCMSDFGKPYDKVFSPATAQQCRESSFSSRCLFDFGDSFVPAFIWLAAAMFSLVAVLVKVPAWLPLIASLLFLYWAWSSFWRARRHLRIYPEGMLLSTMELRFGNERFPSIHQACTSVPFAEVAQIDLRGAGLRVLRQGNLSPLVLIKGLSSKRRHQFHHLFDVQQRRGVIPASITLREPRVSSLSEMAKIVFSGIVIFWILHGLTL